jgi:AraC-like DNA-binding protein
MFPVRFQKPAPALRPYVQFYTQREVSLRDPLVVHPVPARAAPMFEFVFGDRFKIRYLNSLVEETSPRTVVVGMLTRPHAQLVLQGTFDSFVIMFQATGLEELFPVPLSELTNHDYDAHSVLSRSIADLEQRLADCDSFALRVKVADAFLTRRIRGTPRMDRISFAAHQIVSMSGQVRVADLSTYVGFSTRQFEREFGSRFGMRPKLYSRIVRFQAALDSKARSSTKSWTDVAHEFGYYDQMHMIHDFEQFTGATPTETLRSVEIFFREQIEAMRAGAARADSRLVRRIMI